MHPLDDPRLKLTRAHDHLHELDAAVRPYQIKKVRPLAEEFDAQNGSDIYRLKAPPQPPPWVGVLVGDIVHNLRSALDHVAWRLAHINHATPSTKTAFPLIGKWTKNTPRVLSEKLGQMPPDAQEIIKGMQPYLCMDGAEQQLLWLLESLWNIDKHRHIAVTGQYLLTTARIPPLATAGFEIHHKKREVILTIPRGTKTNKRLKPHLTTKITLGMQPPGNGRGVAVLRDIHDLIRDDVLPRFERFFPKRVSNSR